VASLNLKTSDAAIDGTVIESAASRFNMLKQEAIKERATQTAEVAQQHPDDRRAVAQAETASAAAAHMEQLVEAREAKGKPTDFTKVAATDPDSVNQPRKDGVVRAAYKPSVLASRERFILGQHLHASSEIAAVAPLIEQHQRVSPAPLEDLYADAGYFAHPVLALAIRLDINLLCPSGKHGDARSEIRGRKFGKRLFVWQPDGTLQCPAGAPMKAGPRAVDRDGRGYVPHRGTACDDCNLRSQCTTGRSRVLKWYDGDEEKAALEQVMRHPLARERYRARSGMVEPVFAALRERQGLQRFHRRGRVRVAAEFALHCIAYNLRRAEGIRQAREAAAFLFWTLEPSGDVRIAIVVIVLRPSA